MGQDDRLRDIRQGQFPFQQRGGGSIGGHAGHDFKTDPERIEPPDLFADGAIQRRITRMDARHIISGGVRGLDMANNLVEGHRRGVEQQRIVGRMGDHGFRHQ